ncbi:peptide deformylase [Methylocella sp.]|uniref:peptide deformylase n=1 Tax=Methylocella sp. TaxID=1978226 RepID=UPI0035AE8143
MSLSVLAFPDPRLRRKAAPVEAFDDALARLAEDLLAAMRAAGGVGITAPHCGVLSRLVVIEIEPGAPRFYVNPAILEASQEKIRGVEGSVSMPGARAEVLRAARVRVACEDLSGAPREEAAEGFLSVCLQHEIDQLDGIFWLERLSRLKRERLVKAYGKGR